MKNKIRAKKQSGVYENKCKECEALYVRETKTQLEIKIGEHLNPKKYLSFIKHLIDKRLKLDITSNKKEKQTIRSPRNQQENRNSKMTYESTFKFVEIENEREEKKLSKDMVYKIYFKKIIKILKEKQ